MSAKFLKLPNGILSHDRIGRVFSLINPVKFEKCFLEWIKEVFKRTGGEIIPIDGKTLRRSYDKKSGKPAEKTSKRGVNAKRKRAGWDSSYLEKMLDS